MRADACATRSIQVTETQRGERRALKGKKNIAELSTLEWHTLPAEEVCLRLGVAPHVGLDTAISSRRLAKNGRNVITPPPKNLPKKASQSISYSFEVFEADEAAFADLLVHFRRCVINMMSLRSTRRPLT